MWVELGVCLKEVSYWPLLVAVRLQTLTQRVDRLYMTHVDTKDQSQQLWHSDWTRLMMVLGAAAALFFALVFAVSPQNTGQAAGHKTAGGGSVIVAPTYYAVPSTIAANCSVDVSKTLRKWLQGLPPGAVVTSPSTACYLINEGINVYNPDGLTINGGTFVEKTWGKLSRIGINIQGGENVTLENLTIQGPAMNHHVYNKLVEFQGGIELQGTTNAVIQHVKILDVRGDGITLVPLRALRWRNLGGSGIMVRPVQNLTISSVYINGTGRMGISLAGVAGATLTNVDIRNVATDDFDLESDQSTEGVTNLTIDGCTVGGAGALFFSNQGLGAGPYTNNITVENCTMLNRQAGTAVLVENIPQSHKQRGPFYFVNDSIWCGNSDFVSCLMLKNANLSMTDSTLVFKDEPQEPVYNVTDVSTVSFTGVNASNYYWKGLVGGRSTVTITGGSWIAHSDLPSGGSS